MPPYDAAYHAVLNDTGREILNDFLVWVGFGTILGLLLRGLLPGRDPGGAIASVLLGMGGTIMACGLVSYFHDGQRIVPTHLSGMFIGAAGTLLMIFFYKLLGGYYFVDGEYVTRSHRRRHGYGLQRRYDSAVYED